MHDRPRAGIFRHSQLRKSEQFITGQSDSLNRYSPLLLSRDDPGRAASGRTVVSLARTHPLAATSYRLGWRRSIRRFLADADLDVLHAHFGVEGASVHLEAGALGLPLVVTLHGFDVLVSEPDLRRSLRPALITYPGRRRVLFADKKVQFIAVSEFLAERASGLGLDRSRISVVPTGVSIDDLRITPLPNEPRIIHVARLVSFKGTEDLINAFQLVLFKEPASRLDIVGDGPLRARISAQIESLGLSDAVTLHGSLPHDETVEWIRRARVLCLPSRSVSNGATEGLGQVLLEAMALGRVVVATRTGGIPEVVRDGDTGFLVAERSVGELADAIQVALGGGTESIVQTGRNLVERDFDVRKQAARVEAVYDAAVAAR